jgi:hypothetical protein
MRPVSDALMDWPRRAEGNKLSNSTARSGTRRISSPRRGFLEVRVVILTLSSNRNSRERVFRAYSFFELPISMRARYVLRFVLFRAVKEQKAPPVR